MNTVQRDRLNEIQSAGVTLGRTFKQTDLDAFDDTANRIIGLMQELRRDLVEQIESTPPVTLAALMESGRLPVLIGGESPSD